MASSAASPGCRPGLAPGTETTTGFDLRPPSPPPVEIAMVPFGTTSEGLLEAGKALCVNLEPTSEAAQGLGLTAKEVKIITGNRCQVLDEKAKVWSYEDRRAAHPILDYLWLGPSGITRDHEFLRERGFTLILVANELRASGQRLRSIESAADALGIEVKYLDTQPAYQQVGSFNETLQIINSHVMEWNMRQQEEMNILPTSPVPVDPRHAVVLVVCETGNDRSSMIVASYIMAMYSRSMVDTVQYMLARRLSCAFDDNAKRALQTWGDVLCARKAVAPHRTTAKPRTPDASKLAVKRGFADTIDMVMDGADADINVTSHQEAQEDHARFANREAFTPFRDIV